MNTMPWHICVSSSAANSDIELSVLLDGCLCFGPHPVGQKQVITVDMPELAGTHCLQLAMSGKKEHHTELDHNGQIVSDLTISVDSVDIDGIDITELFKKLTVYKHNLNGTGAWTDDKFFGTMGCNGTIDLVLDTPSHEWLLTHM